MISIFLLIGILVVGVIFIVGCKKQYITVEEVHKRIRSEIPLGSTYSQVTDFLKKYNWGTSELSKFEDFGTHADMLTNEEKQKIKWKSTGGIRTMEKDLFWSSGVEIAFYYDQEEKLITYNLVEYRY